MIKKLKGNLKWYTSSCEDTVKWGRFYSEPLNIQWMKIITRIKKEHYATKAIKAASINF